MTTLHFLQLACEATDCDRRYPDQPVPHTPKSERRRPGEYASVPELRTDAAGTGWETKNHTKGRDLCPPCRITEIQRMYGWAFVDKEASS